MKKPMFAQNLRLASRVAALGGAATVLASSTHPSGVSGERRPARCEAVQQQERRPHYDHLDEKDTAGFVGVFLDAASVERVQKAVGGPLGRNAHALIQLHPEPDTKRSFAPLFGSKAKVVVRGVAEDVATQQRVMIVDVSVGNTQNRIVPSRNGHGSVPTISLASPSWDDDVSDLLGVDLARRMLENGVLHAKGSWDGVLPAQVLDGIKYPPTRAIFTEMEEPIALEGTVCASSDYDKQASHCVVRADGTAPQEATGKGDGEPEEGEEVAGECPLCTYMMNSPCKDVFVVFKACIDKAGSTDEQDDLKACEPSAADVHTCIHKFGLFREHLQSDDEEDEDISGDAAGAGGSSGTVQAASPAS